MFIWTFTKIQTINVHIMEGGACLHFALKLHSLVIRVFVIFANLSINQ